MPVPPGDAGAHPRTDARPTHGTVVFIDLAGFTSLTDTHGDEEDSSGPPSELIARGVSAPVPIVEIITRHTQSAVDPVCQLRVSRASAAASILYADHRWVPIR